jgi:GntR family transcriptional repressor for pyruvate dehydrogenase complex
MTDEADLATDSTPAVITLGTSVKRVRKAYEQVADQIRSMIMTGEIGVEDRLPNEARLAVDFGVSRATIREALRVLSTENLIRTAKGSQGGSFVTMPTIERMSASLGANIGLLSAAADISLEEFLELRELLEVPAARLAAARGDNRVLQDLRASIPDEPLGLGIDAQFSFNRDFHSVLVHAAGNKLLTLAAEPIFTVLQTHLKRSTLGEDFHQCVNRDHLAILAALEHGDAEEAALQMHEHLEYLRPMYERAWRYGRRAPS